jgi:hypothetical protein
MFIALVLAGSQIGKDAPAKPPSAAQPQVEDWHLSGDHFGQRVLAFGDVDGDSIPDFAVSDFARDDHENGPGCVWVFSGKERKLITRLEGERQPGRASARFGWALAAPGDLDGDGVPDLLIAARGGSARINEGDLHRTGYARVYSGKTSKIVREFHAQGEMDGFGASVAVLGDLDSDGVPDIAVGADGSYYQLEANSSEYPPCYVRLYSGKTGNLLGVIEGKSHDGRFGYSLCALPDVDGDAVPDLLIGEPGGEGAGRYGRGCVHVVSGKTGVEIHTLKGRDSGLDGRAEFGCSLASLNDLDGDGVNDFAVGCADCYVRFYSGKDRSMLGEVNTLVRGMFASGFADSLCALGDVDGDGVGDLAIGAEKTSFAGEQYDVLVVSGKSRSVLLTRSTGEWYARVGRGGDLTGSGVPYLLVGLWQRDRVELVPIGKEAPVLCLERPVLAPK